MALEDILNYFGSDSGNSLLSGVAGGLLTNEAYKRLSDIGNTAYDRSMDLAERGQQESQFKPFTVTTPTGSSFNARMGGQPQPPMLTGGPVAPPAGVFPIQPVIGGRDYMPQPPVGIMPPMNRIGRANESTDRMIRELLQNQNPRQPQPTEVPRFDTELNRMPGTVMDGGGAFGPVAPPAGMPRFAGGPDSQPAADAMARQYQQPMSQPQEGLNVEMSLSPAEQAMYQGLFGGAGNFFGQAQQPTAGREQDIFNRIRDAQRPEEERQNLALEQRLAAQGRLGVRTADFGGTPEQLAMSKAQSEARNTAMLGAMQQAQAEQAQQAALGQQFLGSSYIPQQQLLAALQPGLTQQQMAQQAQQFGTGLFSETAMSGIESKLIAEQARANLLGGIGSNVLSGLMTPQFNKDGDITSPGGIGSSIEGFADLLTKLFGKS